MLISLLTELQKFGQVFLFGSASNATVIPPNDIDITIVLPDGCLTILKPIIKARLTSTSVSRYVLIQELLKYDKYPSERLPDQIVHLLLCEQQDLQSGHPIIKALRDGLVMEDRNAA